MKTKTMSMIVTSITLVLLLVGAAGAIAQRLPTAPAAVEAVVASGISYQGRLTDPGGTPLNGAYTMRFVVYNASVAGSALWDSGNLNIAVANGLFNVKLGVSQASFNGQALWLSIIVDGQTLSPRQEILPAPYALSLRPGATIVGDALGGGEAALSGAAPATGTALRADANGGMGLYGSSTNNYGVRGSSSNSWGGYFSSSGGHGIRVETSGTDHYDHGAFVTAQGGYGVLARSATNQGVRGEAGNVADIAQPLGAVGVVGIGSNRGTYGASGAGIGVYGVSNSNYGVWGTSSTYHGVTGRTGLANNNYGFYTPDNLYALNYNLAGALMQVMQNGGTEALAPGEVVVFSGINRSVTAVDGPIVQVSSAHTANSTAVAGVVFSRFNIDAVDPDLEFPDDTAQERLAEMDATPPGKVAPGEFLLVVVQGPALVKASALTDSIQPGDLLSTGGMGLAGKAAVMNVEGMETAVPGTVFGKALEPLNGTQEMIYVYVTLQ
ncbi:MAG: hypothetical protein IPM39_09045 [Chloroflexi bacterium]|nr:hypothetical protein [Chloroflexota bacterium]